MAGHADANRDAFQRFLGAMSPRDEPTLKALLAPGGRWHVAGRRSRHRAPEGHRDARREDARRQGDPKGHIRDGLVTEAWETPTDQRAWDEFWA